MALLDAGADESIRNDRNETAWDLIQTNSALAGTDAWRELEERQDQ